MQKEKSWTLQIRFGLGLKGSELYDPDLMARDEGAQHRAWAGIHWNSWGRIWIV